VKEKIEKYIEKNKSKFGPGDILFVGSTTEGRQNERGYIILGMEKQVLGFGDSAVELPLNYRKQLPENVSYSNMMDDEFDRIAEMDPASDEYSEWFDFFNTHQSEMKEMWPILIDDYKEAGLW
jgi:hypothetical protein